MAPINPAVLANRQAGMTLPAKKLIVCALPRTSSSTLMLLLEAAGLGFATEYFNPGVYGPLSTAWNIPWPDSGGNACATYLDLAQRRGQQNGVFTTKLHFIQFRSSLMNETGRSLFAGATVVHLSRINLAEQAVSNLVAHEMSHFSPDAPDRPVAGRHLTDKSIGRMIRHLAAQEAGWRQFFAYAGISPLILTDGDVNQRPLETIARIAQELGVGYDRVALAAQADSSGKYHLASSRKQHLIDAELPKLSAIAFDHSAYDAKRKPALKFLVARLKARFRRN